MKKCSYCGRENADEATQCCECASPLASDLPAHQQSSGSDKKGNGTRTARFGIGLFILAVVIVFCARRVGRGPPGFQRGDILVFVVVLLAAFILWMLSDADRWLALASERRSSSRAQVTGRLPWEELFGMADRTVHNTIAGLPPDLRAEAEKVPCVMKRWPATPYSAWILGHYFGFQRGLLSEYNGPIILYLGAIHRYCTERGLDFEQQVRVTYLHEFGHHLGWDEGELERRGLA
jgi:predicted Zn-dependent protease with MMP-like domain